MAIDWAAPAAEYVNEGSTARQWMMPTGEFVMEAPTGGGGGGPDGQQPVMVILT